MGGKRIRPQPCAEKALTQASASSSSWILPRPGGHKFTSELSRRSWCGFGTEQALLVWVEGSINSSPANTILVTWNGDEFALPFLAPL